jgi:hypothetical protein
MPTEMDYARLAAYIDGEGHIHIGKFGNYDCLRIDVYNTDPRLIVWIKKTFGGGWFFTEFPNERQRFKKYGWYIGAKNACELLNKCMPYFLIKREEAEIGIAFQATKKYHRFNPLPEGMIEKRRDMKLQLQSLHRTRIDISSLPAEDQLQ